MAIRVLLLSWRDKGHPEAGGAEAFLDNVSAGLAARGHDVTIFTADYPGAGGPAAGDKRVTIRRGRRFSVYGHALLHMLRQGHRYDVVVDIQNGVPFWSPLVCRRPTVNLVHHVHREQWPEVFGPLRARFGWWVESRLAPRVYRGSRYLVVSRATRDELADLGVDPDAVTVVYSGREPGPSIPDAARATSPRLVVLGRLVPHKRVELALRCVADLRRRFPGLRLAVVGHGYWDAELRREAAFLGIEDDVTFTGFVADETKHRLLAESWLNLLPSLKEGWGLAIVEAGAHGAPSVAFRSAGGTTESVVDGVTGQLVDDDDEFVSTVAALLADDEARQSLGTAARAHAEGFTWEATTDDVEAVLVAAAAGRALPVADDPTPAADWAVGTNPAPAEGAAGQLAS